MQLEPIPSWRRGELRWVLEVTEKAGGEVRRLLRDGKVERVWETFRSAGGRTEEREFADGVLAARRLYLPDGNLLEEDLYSKGKLSQEFLFAYASSRLAHVRVLAADGSLKYNKDYFYTSQGSLREVRQSGGKEDARDSSFIAGRTGPSEEWNRNGDDLFVSRFDNKGRTIEREHHEGKDLFSQEEFVYRTDSDNLLSSVEKRPKDQQVVTRTYDAGGRLQTETMSVGGKVATETSYARDEKGRVTRKLKRDASGLEEWRYAFDQEGRTIREDYLRRGSLEKTTLYGQDDTRTEELFQDGSLFMKVYFQGDRRTKEEVYADDTLIKVRSFP
jgi:YD repeat-containing protein